MLNEIVDYWSTSTPMKFDTEKWTYDQKRKFRYDLQDYMHKSFEFEKFKGKSVLEVGCGAGIDLMEFARNGATVKGIDITGNAVALTNNLFRECNIGIPDPASIYDGKLIPYTSEMFDCVYSYGVLHHIPDVDTVLYEIKRVLKPGGQIMAMVYNRNSLLYAYSIIFEKGIRDRSLMYLGENGLASMYSERNLGCPYTHVYTSEEIATLFRNYFVNIEVDIQYDVIDTEFKRKVKYKIEDGYNGTPLGWHIIVKGYKSLT